MPLPSAKQDVATRQTVDSDTLVVPIVALNAMSRKGQQQPKRMKQARFGMSTTIERQPVEHPSTFQNTPE